MIRNSGGIEYTLTRKRVKNVNLRISDDLSVKVSAPNRLPVFEIDRFVELKKDWILATIEKMKKSRLETPEINCSDDDALLFFEEISDRIYPYFAKILPEKPLIKVKTMKSRWGVCHTTKNYITLNKQLMAKPRAAVEYVVLHEYVHFLHPNHQKGFHNEMERLMPDYKQRRKMLK